MKPNTLQSHSHAYYIFLWINNNGNYMHNKGP